MEKEKRPESMMIKRDSPNYYKKRNGIVIGDIIIVNHITEGSFASAVSWLSNANSGVSSHFVVGQKGEVVQLVDLSDGAWANGSKPHDSNSKIYNKRAKNEIVKNSSFNANLISVSIEHEGVYAKTKGKLTEAQYKAALELHKHIIQEIRRLYGVKIKIDREHICGHCDVTPIIKPNCPGKEFPFEQLIQDLKEWESEEESENRAKEVQPWKLEGLEGLAEKGIIKNKEYWLERIDDPMDVWAVLNVIKRAMGAV